MRRHIIGTLIMLWGALPLLLAIGPVPAQMPQPVRAQTLPQPSPRPDAGSQPNRGSGGDAGAMGHVTGTVIDLTSGAPQAGVMVLVGDQLVTTDSNGNYDRWVEVGSYPLQLMLRAGQGNPAQGVYTVQVSPEASTVQHLALVLPLPAAADVPTPLPATALPATPIPATALPATAIPATAIPAIAEAPAEELRPARLPATAAPFVFNLGWGLLGVLLVTFGALVGYAPARIVRRVTNDNELLAALLGI